MCSNVILRSRIVKSKKVRHRSIFLLRNYCGGVSLHPYQQTMITTGRLDTLTFTLPPDGTARLAQCASEAGISTADLAAKLLGEAVDKLLGKQASPLARRRAKREEVPS